MDVKSLIQYFNNRSRPLESSQSVTRPAPVYHLNGKVKHLVQEFSKSRHKLLQSLPALQPPNLGERQNGGDAIGGGVFQISRKARQISKEGNNTKYVSPIQYQASLQHQEPKQQHQKQTQAFVGLAKAVSEAAFQRFLPRHSGLGPAHGQELSNKSISIYGHSRYPYRLPTLVAIPRKSNRTDSIDSVVMSARNSMLRKSKSTGQTSSVRGDSLPEVGVQLAEEHSVHQILSRGIEPLSPVHKKATMTCPVEELQLSFQDRTILKKSCLALLAHKCQKMGQSTRVSPISNSVPTPESLGSYKQSTYQITKPSSRQSWASNTQQTSILLSPEPLSSDLATPPGAINVEHQNKQERARGNEPQSFKVPYFTKMPSKRISYDSPQERVYDDTGWRRGSHYVLQGNIQQKAESRPSLLDNLDGSMLSLEPWDTPTPPETLPSPVFPPLTPPHGQFRNYILHPHDTAGQYPLFSSRKMELIQPLPSALSAGKLGLLPYHPCLSTLCRKDSFSDSSISSNQNKYSTSPASTKEGEINSESSPKSSLKRLGRAVRSGHGVPPSPSYLGVVDIHRVLSYANSIDIENKRYASRRKQ